MLTLKFVQRKETRLFEGATSPIPVTDFRLYNADGAVALESHVGYRDKHEASRAWTDLRGAVVANAITVDGSVLEQE